MTPTAVVKFMTTAIMNGRNWTFPVFTICPGDLQKLTLKNLLTTCGRCAIIIVQKGSDTAMISKFTPAELAELAEFDKMVDKGADPYPLTAEQKKIVRSMTSSDRKVTVYNFNKRERKANDDKREIMEFIQKGITLLPETGISTTIEVTNPERELTFTYNGKKYKITLSAPRK